MTKKLSIVVPAYNEEATVAAILDKLQSVELINGIRKELIVVNDASSDRTDEIVKTYIKEHPNTAIVYEQHPKNKGKGAALHTGIALASGDYVVVQDADLEYDPREFNVLLQPLEDGFADIVYGSRFMGGKPHRILFFWHSIGNKILTFISNAMTNLNLTDMETCYKMWRREHIQSLRLVENRFGFEPEVTAKASRIAGIRIYEVGISYYGRTFEEGKKISWKDGFRAIYAIMKYNIWSK